ncbi:MAG: hypothetical protein P0Y49_11690 [Candidatus Pedobacter colombiensis]|uniref:Lipoprotein n=1 Tax=Candidatus Pedobacter colombiensis TaxID=3121371 RepID=A0AAJ5W6H8_9SPHI|nr:hypothetical protein [Pedobacter sp.]WEK17457.1 MAG: hypothetical protein P0Y49_11690 [Pedobacter sp.]
MKRLVLLFAMGLVIVGCSATKSGTDKNLVVLQGKVEALGMSTFQYGTHILHAAHKTYALKSSKVNLKDYEGKNVIIRGLKVVGYPVDGGPEFIDVQEVSNK